jgi:hypothetical protein
MGDRYVIIIGIAEYANAGDDTLDSLPGVRKDRDRFRRTLAQNADERGVKEFISPPLFDARATRRNVIATLRQVADRVKATDQVVLYFAGHAVCMQHPKTKADEY